MVSSKDDSSSDSENSSGDVPESNSRLFDEGEKVLAYHGPKIYEAKVQKTEIRKNEWRYFVHYLGWNKNWDEWVDAERLMKYNEENILKQKSLDKKQGVDKSTRSARSTQTKPKSSADAKVDKDEVKNTSVAAPKGKKRKADSGTELVKLPRTPSVDDILAKYLEYRSKKDGMVNDSIGDILNGLRCYFDKALPTILLYKKERQQYHDEMTENTSTPSKVYGAEHLLRLFVKLPELLAYVKIEEDALNRLQQKLLDFLKFLQKNQSSFFLSSYSSTKVSEGGNKSKDN